MLLQARRCPAELESQWEASRRVPSAQELARAEAPSEGFAGAGNPICFMAVYQSKVVVSPGL